ncbi:MAG: lauroyl acyltransferase, partial [Rickettsiales bacterium]|nr:lauroyl acyltransferase [Rickettsiales bacterium]
LKTEEKIMNYLNKYVESWIKEKPEQWIWIHNRW